MAHGPNIVKCCPDSRASGSCTSTENRQHVCCWRDGLPELCGPRLCRSWQELCPLSEWDQLGSVQQAVNAPRYTTVQITPREAVGEGDSVTLTCSSDGAPPAESFTWFKEGESGSLPDSFKPELRLWSLDYRDHGEYFCVARNPLGTDRSRPNFFHYKEPFVELKGPIDVKGSSWNNQCQ
uniref:Ig-like domain-containing protein n=1 Tax=Sinocyclocheilus grahami TaxID=75366 RepID=A0A672K9Y3_SINGR